MTEEEKRGIVHEVVEEIKRQSQDVSELPVSNNIEDFTSLPVVDREGRLKRFSVSELKRELGKGQDVEPVKTEVAGMKEEVSGVKTEVETLKAANTRTEAEVARLNEGFADVAPTILEMQSVINTNTTSLNDLSTKVSGMATSTTTKDGKTLEDVYRLAKNLDFDGSFEKFARVPLSHDFFYHNEDRFVSRKLSTRRSNTIIFRDLGTIKDLQAISFQAVSYGRGKWRVDGELSLDDIVNNDRSDIGLIESIEVSQGDSGRDTFRVKLTGYSDFRICIIDNPDAEDVLKTYLREGAIEAEMTLKEMLTYNILGEKAPVLTRQDYLPLYKHCTNQNGMPFNGFLLTSESKGDLHKLHKASKIVRESGYVYCAINTGGYFSDLPAELTEGEDYELSGRRYNWTDRMAQLYKWDFNPYSDHCYSVPSRSFKDGQKVDALTTERVQRAFAKDSQMYYAETEGELLYVMLYPYESSEDDIPGNGITFSKRQLDWLCGQLNESKTDSVIAVQAPVGDNMVTQNSKFSHHPTQLRAGDFNQNCLETDIVQLIVKAYNERTALNVNVRYKDDGPAAHLNTLTDADGRSYAFNISFDFSKAKAKFLFFVGASVDGKEAILRDPAFGFYSIHGGGSTRTLVGKDTHLLEFYPTREDFYSWLYVGVDEERNIHLVHFGNNPFEEDDVLVLKKD